MRLENLDHVALTVSDVERSAAWYCEVLGLERRHKGVWGSFPAMVGIGDTMVALFPLKGDRPKPPPDWKTIAMRHVAFRTDRSGFDLARSELRERGIEFEFQDHDISHSIYFLDPDGHELEITTYEIRASD